ncbi:hypothetical protein SDC9_98135 [bioreactor metagenome]|uniref:Uncharacterized protein n=1 Tax=bioreactor metagenome TaxID=1076179 RepID=A0A645AED7_9ZZZZ
MHVGDAQRQRLVAVVHQLCAGVFAGDHQRACGVRRHLPLAEAAHGDVTRQLGVDGLQCQVVDGGEVGKRQREFAARLARFALRAGHVVADQIRAAAGLVHAGGRDDGGARRCGAAVLALGMAQRRARLKHGDLLIALAGGGHGRGAQVGAADQRGAHRLKLQAGGGGGRLNAAHHGGEHEPCHGKQQPVDHVYPQAHAAHVHAHQRGSVGVAAQCVQLAAKVHPPQHEGEKQDGERVQEHRYAQKATHRGTDA